MSPGNFVSFSYKNSTKEIGPTGPTKTCGVHIPRIGAYFNLARLRWMMGRNHLLDTHAWFAASRVSNERERSCRSKPETANGQRVLTPKSKAP